MGDTVGDMQEQINEIYDKLEGAYEEEYDDYDYEEGYDKESDEDYMCELKKDMVKGVFILADQDGDNKVTKEEMTSTLDLAESVDFEMMLEQLFSMADDDMSGEVDYDELWWLMDYKKDSGELSPEDAWAIESVLEWADAELGDHN